MTEDPRRGITLMIAVTAIFAAQDGLSRHLAEATNVLMVVTIRYWFFAAFVMVVAGRKAGGLRQAGSSSVLPLQVFRGVLLATQICVMVLAFTLLGLIDAHAIYICYPLIVAALSVPLLGERVGPHRWVAIALGFVGVLIIIRPGLGVFSPAALVALLSGFMFALYSTLTRRVSRHDRAETSFFWTGVAGAVVMTPVGLMWWEPMGGSDWLLMLLLCISGATGHWLLIRAYEAAEAGVLQPFAYLQFPFASVIGLFVFGDVLTLPVAIGAALIVSSGLYTIYRARRRARA